MQFVKIFSFLSIFAFSCIAFNGAVHAGGGGEKEEGGDTKEYVKLDPLILPVVDNDGVYQIVSMVVSLEVETLSEADKIKAAKPRLADAYIQDMYGIMNVHEGLKNGIVQVALVKERLNKITSKVMGDEVHAEVLLQAIQQQPI